MKKLFEEFCQISLLDEKNASALQSVLSDDQLMTLAGKIAETAFFPGNGDVSEFMADTPELARAWFAAAFLSFSASHQRYNDQGFPESVWRDSMSDLRIWLENELRNRQVIGLGSLARPWQVVIYQGKVTRHGRLECNSEFYYQHDDLTDHSGKTILRRGDAVINLHIPEEGAMDMASCSASVKRMAEFFAECRPDYNWQGWLCESWFLDRQLKNMLPATSNILKFQALGQHYLLHPTDDTVFRIFGTADPFAIKNPTSLQKNAAEFLKNGGTFYEEGIFIPRSQIEQINYDLTKLHI